MLARESPQTRQQGSFLQAELKDKLGIETEIRIMHVSELFERQMAGEFDISPGYNCEGLTRDPAPQLRECWGLKRDGSLADYNLARWRNAEYNAVLTQFEREMDQGRRTQLAKQLADILEREVPVFGRNKSGILWGWYNYVKGLPDHGGESAYDIYRWDYVWLDR
jgi:ABC-type transport system substrate-binding protein